MHVWPWPNLFCRVPSDLTLVHVFLIRSNNDGSRAADDPRSLDMFDAVPLCPYPFFVAPYPQFCTQDAEGEENRNGKKSVKEAHSYRFVPIFGTLPLP